MISIKPYESIGPVSFGMNATRVVELLGPPAAKTNTSMGQTYDYGDMSVMFEGGALTEASFSPAVPVEVRGVDVFADNMAFKKLVLMDGCPREFHGFIVFYNLGIALSGFHDGDEANKAIVAFGRGVWDAFRSESSQFKL